MQGVVAGAGSLASLIRLLDDACALAEDTDAALRSRMQQSMSCFARGVSSPASEPFFAQHGHSFLYLSDSTTALAVSCAFSALSLRASRGVLS